MIRFRAEPRLGSSGLGSSGLGLSGLGIHRRFWTPHAERQSESGESKLDVFSTVGEWVESGDCMGSSSEERTDSGPVCERGGGGMVVESMDGLESSDEKLVAGNQRVCAF
jgi:hypothetical protein